MVRAITSDEDPGNIGAHGVGASHEITAGIDREGWREGLGIGHVADGDEDALHAEVADGAGLLDDAQGVHLLVAENFGRADVEDELDLLMGLHALHHDVGSAERIATMDEVDLGSEAGEEEGFFTGGIAAADDGDRDIAVERTIAGRAGGHAVAAVIMHFTRDAQVTGRGARGDDHGLGFVGGFAALELLDRAGEVDGVDAVPGELRTETFGLALHVRDELIAIHAVDEAREVLDLGGRGQLAAGLAALEHQRSEAGAGGVDRGGQAGTAGAEDKDVFSHGHNPS